MIDTATFRAAMRRLPAQVAVISAQAGDLRIAMTATAVTSLSAEPPQLLVCVHHMARPAAVIAAAGAFGVNLLAAGQQDVATQGALPGLEPEERFARGHWQPGPAHAAPLLEGATVALDCRLVESIRSGTHLIFIGLIGAARFAPAAQPLLYHDGRYCELAAQPGVNPLDWETAMRGF